MDDANVKMNTAHKTLQVLVSIMKWCWSRLPGGVVTWETYDLFKQGETGRPYIFQLFV